MHSILITKPSTLFFFSEIFFFSFFARTPFSVRDQSLERCCFRPSPARRRRVPLSFDDTRSLFFSCDFPFFPSLLEEQDEWPPGLYQLDS